MCPRSLVYMVNNASRPTILYDFGGTVKPRKAQKGAEVMQVIKVAKL